MGVKKIKRKKKMNAKTKKLKYFSIFVPNLHVKNITFVEHFFARHIYMDCHGRNSSRRRYWSSVLSTRYFLVNCPNFGGIGAR